MHHHHITRAIAKAHAADLQRAAARDRATVSVRTRHNRHAIVAALVALGALTPIAGALAQPAHDVATSTNKHAAAIARRHHSHATPGAITFTNPLGRSRGPGAGAGLL
jgi:hypothetical protein